MLIRVQGVTLNVTQVKRIVVKEDVKETKERVHLFKVIVKRSSSWRIRLDYLDADGKDCEFSWVGAESREVAEHVEKELLSQIKEVELEHMSTAIEDAIRGS